MRKLLFKVGGRPILSFKSKKELYGSILEAIMRGILLLLLALFGISQLFFKDLGSEFSRYLFLYSGVTIAWGYFIIRSIVFDRNIFGKTYFDLYLMGILTLSLLSVILSDVKARGVFGTTQFWSLSITTLLSFAILYYLVVLMFRSKAGFNKLNLMFVLSVFVPASYAVFELVRDGKIIITDYMIYAVYSIPLLVAQGFIFKRMWKKIFTFITLLLVLFFTSYYVNKLEGNIFVVSVGVLFVFFVFYLVFWIRNVDKVLKFFKGLLLTFKKKNNILAYLKKNKYGGLRILMMLFAALFILSFGYLIIDFYQTKIHEFLTFQIELDLKELSGWKSWLIGSGDLAGADSPFELMNIIINYGVINALLFVAFLCHIVLKSVKYCLNFSRKEAWRNVIYSSSLVIVGVSLLINLILARSTVPFYILLIFISSFTAIINAVFKNKNLYELPELKALKSLFSKVLIGVMVLAIISLVFISVKGLASGIENGLFEN